MFLTPQVVVEYGNRTHEHQSGHQSSYWLWTSVLNFSDLMRTGVTHSPPPPQNNIGEDRKDKKGKVNKQGEAMVASYRYLGVSNPGLQMLGCNECDVSYQSGTRASFSISEGFLHSIFSGLRRILGSSNLVNPLLGINEAWMD